MRKITFNEQTIEEIREYARSHTFMETCNRFTLKPDTVRRVSNENNIRFTRKPKTKELPAETVKFKHRDYHPRYKGEVSDGKGYLMCLKPEWYTGRAGCTHVFVHTVVMCEALGLTELPKGFVVHHINGDKHDNRIDNLALLTNSAHSSIHTYQRNLCKVQRSEDNRSESIIDTSSETPDND